MRNQWVLAGILASSLAAVPAFAQHKAPNQQPATDAAPAAPSGELVLGTVHLAKATKADGKALPAGTYQVRLTAQEAKPDAKGASENIERWVEFVQRGTVKGREVEFVKTAKGFQAVTVVTGKRGGGRIEIIDGVNPGAVIATKGAFLLKAEHGKGEAEH